MLRIKYDQQIDVFNVIARIAKCVPKGIFGIKLFNNELSVILRDHKYLILTALFLKKHYALKMEMLIDICIVDYFLKVGQRFEIVYNFLNVTDGLRVRVVVKVNEDQLVPSLASVFNSANWLERECGDMFGVYFLNHPDLRRILTDYGFQAFPGEKIFL